MIKVTVVGSGYVGLVTGACLSEFGNDVICVDSDRIKIENLSKGILPIYEPGLEHIVRRNRESNKLKFSYDIKKSIETSDVIFIAVGTPSATDGSADLQYVQAVAQDIGKYMNSYKVVVNKSTVPVKTGQKVKSWINEELFKRRLTCGFDIVSNPEFLREGTAVQDFMQPDRVIIGTESVKGLEYMKEIYREFVLKSIPFIETNVETAEMIKYASNAFLAMKISFINEVANLCEKLGAKIQDVSEAMGKDKRISPYFLQPGAGYGGSCFPKDTLALVEIGKQYASPVTLIEQTVKANEYQKELMVRKVEEQLGNLTGKRLAILGLSFKPNTDDIREAPSITILNLLANKGAELKVYDPVAINEARRELHNLNNSITYCNNEYETMEGSDGLIIITEWDQFRQLNLAKVKRLLKHPFFFDFRNIYRREIMEGLGFHYIGVGQG